MKQPLTDDIRKMLEGNEKNMCTCRPLSHCKTMEDYKRCRSACQFHGDEEHPCFGCKVVYKCYTEPGSEICNNTRVI